MPRSYRLNLPTPTPLCPSLWPCFMSHKGGCGTYRKKVFIFPHQIYNPIFSSFPSQHILLSQEECKIAHSAPHALWSRVLVTSWGLGSFCQPIVCVCLTFSLTHTIIPINLPLDDRWLSLLCSNALICSAFRTFPSVPTRYTPPLASSHLCPSLPS